MTGKQAALQQRYLGKAFRQEWAQEFARHGYVQRLKTPARCLENVFALIPPERTEPIV